MNNSSVRVERGVVAVKNGKVWGLVYKDGQVTAYGWLDDLTQAKISDPRFCKAPTDMTWGNASDNSDWRELSDARLAPFELRTEARILEDK